MVNQLAELLGGLVLFAGLCVLVAASALVSTALAVAVAGFFLVAIGVIIVYVATITSRAEGVKRDAAR